MKKILLSLTLGAVALTANAQARLSVSDLHELSKISAHSTRGGEAGVPIEMIVNVASKATLDEIEACGGEIVNEFPGGTVTVRIDPAKAKKVAGIKGVRKAAVSQPLTLANHEARIFSHVDEVLAGTGLDQPYDGTGVVVGLFDMGLDPNHINFRDKDGNSRVKLWLQYCGSSSTPIVCSTPEEIAKITTDTVVQMGGQSHGTHVAGIMAGSFDTSLGEVGAKNYSGVAQGAEIVMAAGSNSVQMLDAIQRIAQYASEQKKPCVINLSWGNHIGPHDGTDPFTVAINDVAKEYDAVICMSSGNEGRNKIAIVKELTEEKPILATLAEPLSFWTNTHHRSGPVEIWANDGRPFEVTLDVIDVNQPEEVLYSFSIPENEWAFTETDNYTFEVFDEDPEFIITSDDPEFKKYFEKSTMGGTRRLDSNSRYMADLYLYLNTYESNKKDNYVRITVKGHPGQKIFMYTDGSRMIFGNKSKSQYGDAPNGNGTNSNIASGTETICVGSYTTTVYSYENDFLLNDISDFSSWGETPDGRLMPDLCAPGKVIISSRNSYTSLDNYAYPVQHSYTEKQGDNEKTYYWTSAQGTSMAAPHMAGTAALWRQAGPTLTYKDIKEIARTTAIEPGFSTPGWGCGKADALAGIKKILGLSSIYDIMESAPESILIESAGGNVYDIFAPAEKSVSASVVNLQGVTVLSRAAEGESLSLDLNTLPSGIYLLQVTAPHSSRTLKMRR